MKFNRVIIIIQYQAAGSKHLLKKTFSGVLEGVVQKMPPGRQFKLALLAVRGP